MDAQNYFIKNFSEKHKRWLHGPLSRRSSVQFAHCENVDMKACSPGCTSSVPGQDLWKPWISGCMFGAPDEYSMCYMAMTCVAFNRRNSCKLNQHWQLYSRCRTCSTRAALIGFIGIFICTLIQACFRPWFTLRFIVSSCLYLPTTLVFQVKHSAHCVREFCVRTITSQLSDLLPRYFAQWFRTSRSKVNAQGQRRRRQELTNRS